MTDVNIKINGVAMKVPEGSTILEAAHEHGIDIPTLCFMKDVNPVGACRICVVEIKGVKNLMASCVYPVFEGMEVMTHSPRVLDARRKTLQLILSTHDQTCLYCVRSGNCELQRLCQTCLLYTSVIGSSEFKRDLRPFSALWSGRRFARRGAAYCRAQSRSPIISGRKILGILLINFLEKAWLNHKEVL